MCHISLFDPTFLESLFCLDEQIAQSTKEGGCVFCGSPLHFANYTRKPRGTMSARSDWLCIKFSLCCSKEGCRKRHTPPSVRFLGRRVYLGMMIVLATALQQGLPAHREKYLRQFNIPRQTLHRWMKWWKNQFSLTPVWRHLHAFFPTAKKIPLEPLLEMNGADLTTKMTQWLLQLLPLTTSHSQTAMGIKFPQNL